MAWSDPRELREELRRELRDMRRELEDLKRGLAAKHAVQAREIEALRTKSDIAFDRVFRTFKRYAEEQAAFERKWDGQPRDDRGRYSFGKKPKPEAELVSQPAAMRPRGPRPPATPAQQARLAIANARAREAVERVRQLDPDWRPRSLTSSDTAGDYEVMIRAKEAERQEAEAHFMALSRAGEDGPYTSSESRTSLEVLAPRAGEMIRTVNPAEFETIRTNLMVGARQIEPDSRYDGVWYKREDGTVFGLRLSAAHGLTLDVIRSNDPAIPQGFKVHQR